MLPTASDIHPLYRQFFDSWFRIRKLHLLNLSIPYLTGLKFLNVFAFIQMLLNLIWTVILMLDFKCPSSSHYLEAAVDRLVFCTGLQKNRISKPPSSRSQRLEMVYNVLLVKSPCISILLLERNPCLGWLHDSTLSKVVWVTLDPYGKTSAVLLKSHKTLKSDVTENMLE